MGVGFGASIGRMVGVGCGRERSPAPASEVGLCASGPRSLPKSRERIPMHQGYMRLEGPAAMDSAARVDDTLQELTSLYERNAYLVYNVALRTTLEPEAADRAAGRTFLGQVNQIEERRLPTDAARFAIEGAPSIEIAAIEDPLERAVARLSPRERAALALAALTGASAANMEPALQVSEAAAESLLARATADLERESLKDRYFDQGWIEPPQELWAEVYRELHSAVSQAGRAAAAEDQPSVIQKPQRRRRRIPRAVLALLLVSALGGGAAAWQGGGDSGGSEDSETAGEAYASLEEDGTTNFGPDDSTTSGGSGYEALSPEELDKLRKEELEDLKRYSERQNDKSLPRRQRRKAAHQADEIVDLARRRLRMAERREANLRRQLAQEREARVRERERNEQQQEDSEPAQRDDGPQSYQPPEQPKPQRPERVEQADPPPVEDDSRTRAETQAECLYDEQSGTYICPE